MAKTTGPLMSVSASGKFANTIVYLKNGYARTWLKPANPQTTAQQAIRNRLKDIQAELKLLGATLRGELKISFGARWNSDIIGDLMANNHAALDAYEAEFAAFTGGEKTAWAGSDTATPVVVADGALLYACASAIYDRAVRLGVGADIDLTLPANDSNATTATEWTA